MIAAVNRRSPAAVCVVGYLCALAAAVRVGAQPQGGSISGRVVDWNGAMPGAAIRVRPAGDRTPALEATADADGAFAFPNLPPGDYELQVAMPGSQTTTDRRVNVPAAQSATLTIEGYTGCDTFEDERGSTTVADLKDVIGLAIRDALRERSVADDVRVFSTANMPRGVDLAKILPRDWEALTPERIRTRAGLRDGVSYLTISTIRAHGGCIAVAIHDAVAPRKPDAHVVLLGGGGLMNEYRRTAAGWQKKRVYWIEY